MVNKKVMCVAKNYKLDSKLKESMIEDAMKIKNYVEKAAIAGTNMMKKEDL